MSPTPARSLRDRQNTRGTGGGSGALAAPEPPEGAEADALQGVRAYLAASHASPIAFPSIAMEILELVRYPDVDLDELSRYIRVDGALAGGVLALANSAIYRAVRRIDTIKEAVARLGHLRGGAAGRGHLHALALQRRRDPGARDLPADLAARLFLHAVTVARCLRPGAPQGRAARRAWSRPSWPACCTTWDSPPSCAALAELSFFGKLPRA